MKPTHLRLVTAADAASAPAQTPIDVAKVVEQLVAASRAGKLRGLVVVAQFDDHVGLLSAAPADNAHLVAALERVKLQLLQ